MSPAATFFAGIGLLVLFGWYFATDSERIRRMLGTALTIAITAFCLASTYPPFDQKRPDGTIVRPGKIHLGLDLQGGTSFLIRLEPAAGPEGTKRPITKSMVDQAIEAIRKRVDQFGVSEPIITPQGTDRILVQIPGLDAGKIQEARTQLQRVAKLEFRMVYPDNGDRLAKIDQGQEVIPPDYRIETYTMRGEENEKSREERLLIKKKADLGGDRVTESHAYYGNEGWTVQMKFDGEGAKKFGEITAANKGHRFAIVLDGVVISAPVIRDAIYGGDAIITGKFGEAEARGLASVLENPLQTPVKIEEERQVSASLGSDSIKSGIYSGIAGFALVVVFMIIYYRLVGLIADIALAINCIMVVGALGMFNSVLTLPGIAGLILSLGIAVDANVLIYERLRDEIKQGKTLRTAIDTSYVKAFSAIFDAHVTQFLTAVILFWLASGPVKGFALTLTIGIVASMFSSLLVTYTCFSWAFALNLLKRVSMLHLIRSKDFDFLGNAKKFMLVSGIATVACLAVLFVRGNQNLGADFRGGDLMVLSASQKLTPDQIRIALANTGLQNSVIQSERVANRDLISIRSDAGNADKIKARLQEALPGAGLKFEQTDHVGALVGKELASKSALALTLGLIGIFIYVSMRFGTSFAVGSLAALAHDLIITLGIFSLSGRELSLIMVAAVLTIAGYSINDKIVVFDRIRSGLRDRLSGSIAQVMNHSINDTLSRTILTGGTVLLTVLALYFFGGPVLNDFAFSFLVGVIVGTYSSIFIASPIVLWWTRARGKDTASLRREVTQATTSANPIAR
ncbi:MAG TPA: protein translocase subunit SecD [Chthoniobacterales bacterium]|jgi:SecD/SecF fusion protein|nr:protein translocase subunit SecD [Chthoniobacterales bacterium]